MNTEIENWYHTWMKDHNKSGIATVNILDMLKDFAVQFKSEPIKSNGVGDELHPDSQNLLKVCFEELRLKMIKSQNKYGWSNEWLTQDWEDECRQQLIEHLQKGDPRDVAVYAMFMIYRGWTTKQKSIDVGDKDAGIDIEFYNGQDSLKCNCFDEDTEMLITVRDNGKKAKYNLSVSEAKELVKFISYHLKNAEQ